MGVTAFAIAVAVAVLFTSFQLWRSYQRLPFGDEKNKAVGWWLFVVTVDGVVAALAVAGAFTVSGLDQGGLEGVARPVVVGLLAPLALRSPVWRAQIKGQVRDVGLTYVYDVVRIGGLQALDDRIANLRRTARKALVDQLLFCGWTPTAVRGRIERHLNDLPNWDPREVAEIRRRLRGLAALAEDRTRLDGLLALLQEKGLTGLIDGMAKDGPDQTDTDRGQAALRADVEAARAEAGSAQVQAAAAEEATDQPNETQ